MRLFALTLIGMALSHAPQGLPAQTPDGTVPALSVPARSWIDAAAKNQEGIVNGDDSLPLRYRIHKVDSKESTVREVIETRDGTVARMIAHDGVSLTAAEDQAERERLQDILESPGTFLSHKHRDRASRAYALELIRTMPQAMVWTYAPGQPQLHNASGPQVVIDFRPDPGFRPPTLVTEALTGIAGRVWIDSGTHCVTRVEGDILHPVDFGWGGLLARVNQGGSIGFEQERVSGSRWLYSHLSEHLTVREMLFHTVRDNTEMDASDAHVLPRPISYREAIEALLSMRIPLR